MKKLDRLGWADGLAFRSYGLRIGVRVSDRAAMESVIDRLPPGWKPAASPIVDHLFSLIVGGQHTASHVQRFNLLYYDALRLARTKELDLLLKTFESELQLLVAEFARGRTFVHLDGYDVAGAARTQVGRKIGELGRRRPQGTRLSLLFRPLGCSQLVQHAVQ